MEHQREEGEQETSPFYRELASVGECTWFSFQNLYLLTQQQPGGRNVRWTMDQSRSVFDALMAHKTIEGLSIYLEICRPEAIVLFVECIRSIKSISSLQVQYNSNHRGGDSAELQRIYQDEFDNIFHAVLQNPSITELDTTWLGSPESIFELLSKTSALEDFNLSTSTGSQGDPNYDTALHTEAGFRQNTSLKRVRLDLSNVSGNLGVIISGLEGHLSLKDLTIRYQHPDVHLYAALSMVLRSTTLLEKLQVCEEEGADPDDYSSKVNFDKVLIGLSRPSLFQPVGAGLKKLILINVRIGLGSGELAAEPTTLVNKVNTILEELTLRSVIFVGRNGVSVLWHLTGLRMLHIEANRYEDSADDDKQPGHDEQVSSGWKVFIERNPKLEKASTNHVNNACFKGVVEGGCSHGTLKCLEHTGNPVIDLKRGTLLQGLLQKSKSLKHLYLKCTTLKDSGLYQLVPGLSSSTTLETLDLAGSEMDANMYTTIIGILIVNKKITCLRLGKLKSGNVRLYEGNFRRTLLSVARLNTTLLDLNLSRVRFRDNAMDEFLGGFSNQNKLKILDLSTSSIFNEGLVALGRGLERENIFLTCVHLPHISDGDSSEAFKEFIESLKRVSRRFKVTFASCFSRQDLLESLLQAAKENKNLLGYGPQYWDGDMEHYDIYREIELYLKLNRCGRCLFGSPSMPNSIWPVILAPLAASNENSIDALFYAVREYFMSCKSDQEGPFEESRPNKRARTCV